MHTYKYIIFIVFFIISCEKNNSIVDIDGQAYISLCGSSELSGETLSVLSFNRLNGTSLINCSQVIEELQPDIIVKGGDYAPEEVVGSNLCEVRIFNYIEGYSTTKVLESQ